jgi:hypothetical protein
MYVERIVISAAIAVEATLSIALKMESTTTTAKKMAAIKVMM